MPRDGRPARRRLQQAALDLFQESGFDRVTAAEIAARAGVTERTFYRHFADKREVLFDEAALRDVLVDGVATAPPALAPLPTLLRSFRAAIPMLEQNRPLSAPMQQLIAVTPALRERAQAKNALLTEELAAALRGRGVADSTAALAAEVGMATFRHASTVWFQHPEQDPDTLVRDAFRELHSLAVSLPADEPPRPVRRT